jgi:hypothetical protein
VIAKAIIEARRVLKTGGRLLSIMYSHDHPSRQQGRNLGDDTYVIGAGAYFSDVGITHFATREDVQGLFGAHLTIGSLVHTREEDVVGGRPVNAHWRIECEKTA